MPSMPLSFCGKLNRSRSFSENRPVKPQQNAYIERYNRTVRGEWLGQYIIEGTSKNSLSAGV